MHKLPPTDRFVAESHFRVRYAETDAMGIAHHSSYVIYFEEGRTQYIRQRGKSYSEFEHSGFFLTVTEVHARYLQPARYEQRLIAHTWINDLKSRGLAFGYEIVDAETGSLITTGNSKHICVNREGVVTRIPEAWRKWVG